MESLYLSHLFLIILFIAAWVQSKGFKFWPPEKFGQEFIGTGWKKAKGTFNFLSVLMLRSGYFFIYIFSSPEHYQSLVVRITGNTKFWGFPASSEMQKSIKKLEFLEAVGIAQLFLSSAWAWKSCGKNTPGALPMWKFPGTWYWCMSLFLGELGRGCRHLLPNQSLPSGIFGIQDGVQTKGMIIWSAINALTPLTQEQGCE